MYGTDSIDLFSYYHFFCHEPHGAGAYARYFGCKAASTLVIVCL